MKSCNDRGLMERLARGEHLALNEIMERYKSRLFAFVRRYTGDDELAYDLVQETFIKVYFSAASYKPEYAFSSWLFQIALNLCRDHNRRKKLVNFFSLDDEDLILNMADRTPDAEALLQSSQGLEQISQAIASLPDKLKAALILFTVEGLSQEECAALLGTTTKTVETRVYRARKLLEEKLLRKK